jgi:hypothetical protein
MPNDHTEGVIALAKRYLIGLAAALLLGCLVASGTLIAILKHCAWHDPLFRLLHYSWTAFLTTNVGSTGHGFANSIIVALLTIVGTVFFFGYLHGRDAMKKHFWESAIIGLTVLVVVMILIYAPQFIWQVVQAGYDNHEQSSSTIQHLSEFSRRESELNHNLTEAQSKADNWQQAYVGVSKGERIPDRILNSEQTDKLHDQLLRLARDSKSKEFSRVEVTSAFLEDRESSQLAGQLLKVFQDSGWVAHWPTSQSKGMKDFFLTSYPVHVLIYTDGSAHNADWIRLALNDVGVDATVPEQMPPGIKGTVICVGYKQFP